MKRITFFVESQKLRSLGTLTAGVAHELNNPLSNISTSCQIISEEGSERLSEYHRELLTSIEDQTFKARDIVRALLEFSRESDFVFRPIKLLDVVDDTLKLIKGEVPGHIQIQVNIPEGIKINLDKARIQQALLNVIVNGLQAMEGKEEGILTVQGFIEKEKGKIILEVADTGRGIPSELLPQLFDPFFTTKEVGKGTGLGLSLTYGIIQLHGGNISAQSELGRGTRIIIELPLSGDQESGSAEESSHDHR